MSLNTASKTTQQNWFRSWQEAFGFPADYVTLDLVTTGKNLDDNLILAVDLCQVRNHELAEAQHVLLNWVQDDSINHPWLAERMERTALRLASQNYAPLFTYDALAQAPGTPQTVLADRVRTLDGLPASTPLIGHNLIRFDLPFLAHQTGLWLGQPYRVAERPCIDVGLMEKARRLGLSPAAGESLAAFFQRVAGQAGTEGWSLARCVARHLEPPFGCASAAGFVHEVLQSYRYQAEHADEYEAEAAVADDWVPRYRRPEMFHSPGYCQLCREMELDLYGTILSRPGKQHTAAVALAGCWHPAHY